MAKRKKINPNQEELFRKDKEGNLVAKKLSERELGDENYQIKLKVRNLEYNHDLIPKDVKQYIDSHKREYGALMGQVILADMGIYENNFINEYRNEYMEKFHRNTFEGNPNVERAIKAYILQTIVCPHVDSESESYERLARENTYQQNIPLEEIHKKQVPQIREQVPKQKKEYQPDLSWLYERKNSGGID